jgi:alcohol dehydrogenase class IV
MNSSEIRKRLMQRIIGLKREVGLGESLGVFGVNVTDIPSLSKNAIKDPCILTNPRKSSRRDVEVMYEEAL